MSSTRTITARGLAACFGAGVLLVGALTDPAAAQPQPRPDHADQLQLQPPDRLDERDDRGGPGARRGVPRGPMGPGEPGGPGMFGRDGGPPTAGEIDRLREFAATHSPRRWDALQRLTGPARERVTLVMAMRHRGIERLRDADPEVYQLRVARVGKEDEVFGLWRDLMDAPAEQVAPLRDRLRQAVRELVELGLAERRLRLTRLEERLAAERARLEQDEANVDALVEEHLSSVQSQGLGSLIGPDGGEGDGAGPPPDRPGGPGRGMGRGPGGPGPGPGPGAGPRGRERRPPDERP